MQHAVYRNNKLLLGEIHSKSKNPDNFCDGAFANEASFNFFKNLNFKTHLKTVTRILSHSMFWKHRSIKVESSNDLVKMDLCMDLDILWDL